MTAGVYLLRDREGDAELIGRVRCIRTADESNLGGLR